MRKAITCAVLVALFVLGGCGCCDKGCGSSCEPQPGKCQVPYVIGMNHDAAHDAIVNAGLMPACTPSCYTSDPCIWQNPAAGTWLNCKDVVKLSYGVVDPVELRTPRPGR